MKQKPVAWMRGDDLFEDARCYTPQEGDIPLYTAPKNVNTDPFGWVIYNPDWFMESHYYVHGKEPVNPKQGYIAKPLYTAPKELSDEEMNEIIQFLNQSRISWSGNEFIKEAMRLAIKKATEERGDEK